MDHAGCKTSIPPLRSSFCSRFLFTCISSACFAGEQTLRQLNENWVKQMVDLFENGVEASLLEATFVDHHHLQHVQCMHMSKINCQVRWVVSLQRSPEYFPHWCLILIGILPWKYLGSKEFVQVPSSWQPFSNSLRSRIQPLVSVPFWSGFWPLTGKVWQSRLQNLAGMARHERRLEVFTFSNLPTIYACYMHFQGNLVSLVVAMGCWPYSSPPRLWTWRRTGSRSVFVTFARPRIGCISHPRHAF